MEEQPAIDVNVLRDPSIRLNGLDGVDMRYTFYYDETNNIRRLSVSEDGFNVAEPQVFVLGGIVHAGSPRDLNFADLRSALRLQPTVKELKFEHVAHGEFLTILGSRKLSIFLEWLEEQQLDLHYLSLDHLYWATVDIIDSVIAGDAGQLAMVAPQLKNDLYHILREDPRATADFFYRFGYPDLQASQRSAFMGELLDLLEYREGSLPHFNHYMLKGILQMGARSRALPFIEDETPHLLIGEFSSFFVHRICLFKNSQHILDDEDVVKAAIGDRRFIDAGRLLYPYRFARSHDEHGIQISDAVVALPPAYSRRIRTTVSKTNIPISPPENPGSCLNHRNEGSLLDADHPANGVLFARRSTRQSEPLARVILNGGFQERSAGTSTTKIRRDAAGPLIGLSWPIAVSRLLGGSPCETEIAPISPRQRTVKIRVTTARRWSRYPSCSRGVTLVVAPGLFRRLSIRHGFETAS